jgi:hypothetical protein
MIHFNVEQVGKFLEKNGIVYTMRKKRSEGKDLVSIYKRTIGRANITLMGPVTDKLLESHVFESGFNSIQEWKLVARIVHDADPSKLFLYKVEMIK